MYGACCRCHKLGQVHDTLGFQGFAQPRCLAVSVSRCLQIRFLPSEPSEVEIGRSHRVHSRHPQVDRSSHSWHLLASQALRLAECLLPRRSRIQLPSEPRMKHCNNMQQVQTIFQHCQDNQEVVGNESKTRVQGLTMLFRNPSPTSKLLEADRCSTWQNFCRTSSMPGLPCECTRTPRWNPQLLYYLASARTHLTSISGK